MKIQIANPIYDVVFKFLMEDSKVAKTLLSALIGQEIIELDFLPQEMSMRLGAKRKTKTQTAVDKFSLTIYRMDFSAKIRTPEGSQQIIIELQKARLYEDITRFRAYLGKQYQNQDFFVWLRDSKKKYKAGIPIFAIYFLGYELEALSKIPVVLVDNLVRDRFTKNILDKNEPFISSLFHEGMIVNVPALKGKRRDEVEKLLSIFDQSNRSKDFHILNVSEQDFPEAYQNIIRRLQAASQDAEMLEKMLVEDQVMTEFQQLEEALEQAEVKLNVERKAKEEAEIKLNTEQQAKEQAEAKAEQAEAKAEQAEAKAEQAEAKAEQTLQKLVSAVKMLSEQGLSIEKTAEMFGISEKEVRNMLST